MPFLDLIKQLCPQHDKILDVYYDFVKDDNYWSIHDHLYLEF